CLPRVPRHLAVARWPLAQRMKRPLASTVPKAMARVTPRRPSTTELPSERMTRTPRFTWGCFLLGAALVLFCGCKKFQRKHIPVDHVTELGYPTCDGAPLPDGEVVGQTDIRSGPTHIDHNIVEHFTLKRRGCLWSATVRQEWPLQTADVEVLYDASFTPL